FQRTTCGPWKSYDRGHRGPTTCIPCVCYGTTAKCFKSGKKVVIGVLPSAPFVVCLNHEVAKVPNNLLIREAEIAQPGSLIGKEPQPLTADCVELPAEGITLARPGKDGAFKTTAWMADSPDTVIYNCVGARLESLGTFDGKKTIVGEFF